MMPRVPPPGIEMSQGARSLLMRTYIPTWETGWSACNSPVLKVWDHSNTRSGTAGVTASAVSEKTPSPPAASADTA